ncbi:MAG: chlorophyll synthase ChlG [Pseudomonadota bacterium]
MQATAVQTAAPGLKPLALLELLKPITWFPPMWAFGCGLVSSGATFEDRWWFVVGGIALAGPLLCGTSQVVNDWFDRHVDAVNEPNRPIPSGRVPGRIGLWFAILWSAVSIAVAAALGVWVLAASSLGLLLAWAYSAPPARLKLNGWWGNGAAGLCYEGLPWFTAAAALSGTLPGWEIISLALLYSVGAHGIMTLNDFKALKGDHLLGVRSLPVQLGPERAARVACWVMTLPQLAVIGLLVYWQAVPFAAAVGVGVLLQLLAMKKMLRDPEGLAPWYNGTGVTLYVLGMLVSAFALRLEVLA